MIDSGTASPIRPRPPRTKEPPTRPSPTTASMMPTVCAGVIQDGAPPGSSVSAASPPATMSVTPRVIRPTLDRLRCAGGSGAGWLGSGRSQANGAAPSGSQAGGRGSATGGVVVSAVMPGVAVPGSGAGSPVYGGGAAAKGAP